MRVPLPGGACACGFDDPGRFEVLGRREREDDLLEYLSRVIIVASRKLDDVRRERHPSLPCGLRGEAAVLIVDGAEVSVGEGVAVDVEG